MLVVSMTSRALVKKIVQERGRSRDFISSTGGDLPMRWTEPRRDPEEDPSPLQFLKYYASLRQNYGVGTFHISNQDIKIKNVEVCAKGYLLD
jgi:hypothetical protein